MGLIVLQSHKSLAVATNSINTAVTNHNRAHRARSCKQLTSECHSSLCNARPAPHRMSPDLVTLQYVQSAPRGAVPAGAWLSH